MKKFLSLMMMTLLCVTAWAGTVTIDLTAQGYANAADVTTLTQDGVTLTFAKGTNNQNAPKYYNSGTSVRMYTGNTLTIAAEENITAISITANGNNTFDNGSFNTGTKGNDNLSWTGSSNEVVYTVSTGQTHIKTITVTTGDSNEFGIKVTPAPVEGKVYDEPVTVSIELLNATDDAIVTYTVDGETKDYTEPFTLYKTTTLTVNALNGDDDMTEAEWSGTYTIELPALEFTVTPKPGTYATAQEITIKPVNAVSDFVVVWAYTYEDGESIEGDESNLTFTADKSGVLTIMALEDNTDREWNCPEEGYAYTIDPNYQPPVPTNKYQLVTSNDGLEVGENYIILTTEHDAAMGALTNSNKGGTATGFTMSEDNDIATLSDDTDVMVLKLDATNAGALALAMPDGNYINITNNSTNIASSVSKTPLVIDIADSGVATIKGSEAATRQILYQYGSANAFGNYASTNATGATYSTIALYKQVYETPAPDPVITLTPAPGTYTADQVVKVTVENQPEGSKVQYMLGDATAFTDYTDEGITITQTSTLTVVLVAADGNILTREVGTYTINKPISITFTPDGGNFYKDVNVLINVENLPEGAVVTYSLLDEEEDFICMDEPYTEAGVTVTETGYIMAVIYDADGKYLADEFSEDFIITRPEITLTPDGGSFDGPVTVTVNVENMPADAKITYVYDTQHANAPRRAEGDMEEDYTEGGIELTESGLLTVFVRDLTGEVLASAEAEFTIKGTHVGIEALTAGKAVKNVRYFNVAGVESTELMQGVNIVVVDYADGTQAVAKIVK